MSRTMAEREPSQEGPGVLRRSALVPINRALGIMCAFWRIVWPYSSR